MFSPFCPVEPKILLRQILNLNQPRKCPKQSKVRIHVSAMLFSVTTLTFVILSVNTINTIGENQFNQGSYLTLTNDDANQPTNKRINPTSSNDDSKGKNQINPTI